jgi:hypothetical protein
MGQHSKIVNHLAIGQSKRKPSSITGAVSTGDFQGRSMAIEKLSTLDLSPIEKIQLARDQRVSKWLIEGTAALATSFGSLGLNDIASAVGWQTAAMILAARDTVKSRETTAGDLLKAWKCYNCDTEVSITTIDPGRARLMCVGGGCPAGMYLRPTSASDSGTIGIERDATRHMQDATSTLFQEESRALDA